MVLTSGLNRPQSTKHVPCVPALGTHATDYQSENRSSFHHTGLHRPCPSMSTSTAYKVNALTRPATHLQLHDLLTSTAKKRRQAGALVVRLWNSLHSTSSSPLLVRTCRCFNPSDIPERQGMGVQLKVSSRRQG